MRMPKCKQRRQTKKVVRACQVKQVKYVRLEDQKDKGNCQSRVKTQIQFLKKGERTGANQEKISRRLNIFQWSSRIRNTSAIEVREGLSGNA